MSGFLNRGQPKRDLHPLHPRGSKVLSKSPDHYFEARTCECLFNAQKVGKHTACLVCRCNFRKLEVFAAQIQNRMSGFDRAQIAAGLF